MTFDGWQEWVQSEFALDIYSEMWPGCSISEVDTAGKSEEIAKLLDFGDVDKIITVGGVQQHMAQRFRKPYNGGTDPDFTLRYSRPRSDNVIEYERLMQAHTKQGASYPRRYAFGRVYEDHTQGIYEMYILDTDVFLDGVKSGKIPEDGPIPVNEGQEMMSYSIEDIRRSGAIVNEWSEGGMQAGISSFGSD